MVSSRVRAEEPECERLAFSIHLNPGRGKLGTLKVPIGLYRSMVGKSGLPSQRRLPTEEQADRDWIWSGSGIPDGVGV